jgi:pyridoxamine 5'-phosphate oxidase
MHAPPRLHGLEDIEAALWQELAAATTHRGHEWRHAVLATVDGDAADARTVVLRDCDAASRELLIYTDERSPKVRQIDAHPLGTLVLWSKTLGWQLRLRVALSLESSGLTVSSRWAQLKMTPAAQDYLSPLPPGSTIDAPAELALGHPLPERGTREFFAVLTAQVQAVDWLELHAEGQRRARFDARGARWLAP